MKTRTFAVVVALLTTFTLALTTNQGHKLNKTIDLYPETYLLTKEELFADEDRTPLTASKVREREKEIKRRFNEALIWFSARLRTFIFGLEFDRVAFRLEEQHLQNYFSELSEWAQSFKENNEFDKKVDFARHFMMSMKIASEYLEYFNTAARNHQLLRNIVRLNLRLISLHTFSGLPNRKVPKFQEKVKRLTRYLNFWYREFHKIPKMDLSERILFESQVLEASKVLNDFSDTGSKD